MRLIDADALIDVLTQRCCKNCDKRMGTKNGKRRMIYEIGEAPCRACDVDDMKTELEEAPTIDAVEVVRCKDCKYSKYKQGELRCYIWSISSKTKEDGYCFCGARMEADASKCDELEINPCRGCED